MPRKRRHSRRKRQAKAPVRPALLLAAARPAPAPRPRRAVRGLPLYLTLSLAVHAVLLLSLARVNLRSAQADGTRYTRVRLVRLQPNAVSGRAPRVSLPGASVRPAPQPPAEPTPDAEELRRQLEQIAALRADFFKPMTMQNAPMPVLLPSMSGSLPPLWEFELPPGVSALPEPSAQERQLAEVLRAPETEPEKPDDTQALSAPDAAAELLERPLVVPPDPEPSPEVEAMMAARPMPAADTPPGDEPPGTAETEPEEAAVTVSVPNDDPQTASTTEEPLITTPPTATPAETPIAKEEGEGPVVAKADAAGETKNDPPATETKPKPFVLPSGGQYASISGSFHIAAWSSSAATATLAREVSARTSVTLSVTAPASTGVNAAETPLVYLHAGSVETLTEPQQETLKGYLLEGGTLFVDGAAGEAAARLRAELAELLGQTPTHLPSAHPLYRAFYRIPEAPHARLFPLEAIVVEGRPVALFSSFSLGRRWQNADDPDHEAAVALGVNAVVYAVGRRAGS